MNLCGGPRTVLFGEQDVVVLIAVERRVEIDEVHRLIGDIPPENVQVVAVIERVHLTSSSDLSLFWQALSREISDRGAPAAPDHSPGARPIVNE